MDDTILASPRLCYTKPTATSCSALKYGRPNMMPFTTAQGRLDGSASLGEESLAMKRRIHGSKDHSDVATVLAAH